MTRPIARIVRMVMLSAAARGPGALFPAVLAMYFGASQPTDTFFFAFTTLWMTGIGIGMALETASVPHAAYKLREGPRAAADFAEGAARNAMLLGGLSIIFGVVLLSTALAIAGWRGSSTHVFVMYLFLAPTGIASCVSGVYSGCLTAGWKLESTIISNSFRGVGALVGAFAAGAITQIWPVALGLCVGETSRAIWLRRRWRILLAAQEPTVAAASSSVGTYRRDTLYQAATNVLLCVPPMVDRILAAGIAVAAISHVDYAYRTAMLAAILFEGGIAPWLLAQWSNLRARSALTPTWTNVYRPIAMAAAAAVSLGITVFVAAPLIVRVLLEHGKFEADDALIVTELLRWYGVGLILNMTALCFERLLLAQSRNRTYFWSCVTRVSVRIAALLLLAPSLGLLALPAAFVAAEACYLSLLLLLTWRRRFR